MRRWCSKTPLIFNETLRGFDDAKGDRTDHRHDKLPDVLQLGLPNASFNSSCPTTPYGNSFILQSLLCSFLCTLKQLFSNGCISAFRRGDDSDWLSMPRAFSETHSPA